MFRRRIDLDRAVRLYVFLPVFLAIILLLGVNIFDRFVLEGLLGLIWVEEVCVILMVWLVFLSAYAVGTQNAHIRVEIVRLPPFLREALDDAATVLFLGFLVSMTWELMPRTFSRYPATGWPVKVGYYAIIVGGALTIFATLAKHILRRVR